MIKSEKGFTLIEMLIVLTIITILILLIVPNLTKNSESVHDQGCDALVKTVQAQVSAYQLEEGTTPQSISELTSKKYISNDQTTCKNGKKLTISNDGEIILQNEGN